VATVLFGTGLAALSFSRQFHFSLFLMLFAGTGMMLHAASGNTILQTITDDDKRGRVMSFYTLAIMGTAPFGINARGGIGYTVSYRTCR